MRTLPGYIAIPIAIAIAMCVLLIVILQFLAERQSVLRAQVGYIGQDLIRRTNSPSLISIGPDLQQSLGDLLSSKTELAKVLLSDDPTIKDGQATARLILTNEKRAAICIRLRKDRFAEGKFHVLGFKTIFLQDPGDATKEPSR
jgi:hypothetical protein